MFKLGKDDSADRVMLLRRHEHLIRGLENNELSRKRAFSNSTVTVFILGGCLASGYVYARLQQDEVLRRLCYNRYGNIMFFFDKWSPVFESNLARIANRLQAFDSTYFFWYFKTNKLAEYRAYKRLEGEIIEKQANEGAEGDQVTKAILEIEKEMKD